MADDPSSSGSSTAGPAQGTKRKRGRQEAMTKPFAVPGKLNLRYLSDPKFRELHTNTRNIVVAHEEPINPRPQGIPKQIWFTRKPRASLHSKSIVPQHQVGEPQTSQNIEREVVGIAPSLATKQKSKSNVDTIALNAVHFDLSGLFMDSHVGPLGSHIKVVNEYHNYQLRTGQTAKQSELATSSGADTTQKSFGQYGEPTNHDSKHHSLHDQINESLFNEPFLASYDSSIISQERHEEPLKDLDFFLNFESAKDGQPKDQTHSKSTAINQSPVTNKVSIRAPRVYIGRNKSTKHGTSILCKPSSSTSIGGHAPRKASAKVNSNDKSMHQRMDLNNAQTGPNDQVGSTDMMQSNPPPTTHSELMNLSDLNTLTAQIDSFIHLDEHHHTGLEDGLFDYQESVAYAELSQFNP